MLVDYKDPLTRRDGTVRRTFHIDTAVVEPACARGLNLKSATLRGAYASNAANHKTAHYTPLLPPGTSFLPAVVETHGFLHHSFRRIFHLIAEHVSNSAQLGSDVSVDDKKILRSALINMYYQKLSVTLQRQVVECISSSAHRLASNFRSGVPNPIGTTRGDPVRFHHRAHVYIGNFIRTANSPLSF